VIGEIESEVAVDNNRMRVFILVQDTSVESMRGERIDGIGRVHGGSWVRRQPGPVRGELEALEKCCPYAECSWGE
jgi:hypothetical protein